MATSHGIDDNFRRPGRQKSWRKGWRQPGNAPKARWSHLTAADVALKGLSEGLTCEDCKGPLKDAAPELRHFALTDSWYLHVFPVFSYNFPFVQVFLFLKTGTKNLLQPLAGVKAIKYTV